MTIATRFSNHRFWSIRPVFVIHSAVHAARLDAGCVLHTHTRAGVPVSAQKAGVLPISQQSTFVLASLAYHTKAWPFGTTKSRGCRPTWAEPTF